MVCYVFTNSNISAQCNRNHYQLDIFSFTDRLASCVIKMFFKFQTPVSCAHSDVGLIDLIVTLVQVVVNAFTLNHVNVVTQIFLCLLLLQDGTGSFTSLTHCCFVFSQFSWYKTRSCVVVICIALNYCGKHKRKMLIQGNKLTGKQPATIEITQCAHWY